jgi:Cro/C1-type helix-turn-helix DNA-binding protein
MSEKDLKQLRQVLREAVQACHIPVREMERRLGIGHGNLYHIFDGTLDLRVRHLLQLAELLGVPPTDLLEFGCPDAIKRAPRRLGDWLGQRPGQATPPAAASLSLEQLKELIRDAVREELAQQSPQPARTRRARS